MRFEILLLAGVACSGPAPVERSPVPPAAVPDAATVVTVDAAVEPAPWAALDGCELPFELSELTPVADTIEFELSAADHEAIGQEYKRDVVDRYEPGSAGRKRIAAEIDDWIEAGAPFEIWQAVRVRLDPDDRPDRVVVGARDDGRSVIVLAAVEGSPDWHFLNDAFLDPRMRVIATIDHDGDGWNEAVFVYWKRDAERSVWLLSPQGEGKRKRFAYIEATLRCDR